MQDSLYDLKPGEWLVNDFRRMKWNKPRWTGPFQVLFVTHTTLKTSGRTSHCRRVPKLMPEQENDCNQTALGELATSITKLYQKAYEEPSC